MYTGSVVSLPEMSIRIYDDPSRPRAPVDIIPSMDLSLPDGQPSTTASGGCPFRAPTPVQKKSRLQTFLSNNHATSSSDVTSSGTSIFSIDRKNIFGSMDGAVAVPSPDPKSEPSGMDAPMGPAGYPANADEVEKYVSNNYQNQTKNLFERLKGECEIIEMGLRDAEVEVLKKEDEAFALQRMEIEISKLMASQAAEIRQKKEAFQAMLDARSDRKEGKAVKLKMFRSIRLRDVTIQQQNEASRVAELHKDTLTDKRQAFDALQQHLEKRHTKYSRQVIAAQERKIAYEKNLQGLSTRHLRVSDLNATHVNEVHTEKERLANKKEQIVMANYHAEHAAEMKRLAAVHRQQLRQFKKDKKEAAGGIAVSPDRETSRGRERERTDRDSLVPSEQAGIVRSLAGSYRRGRTSSVARPPSTLGLSLQEDEEPYDSDTSPAQNQAADYLSRESLRAFQYKHRAEKNALLANFTEEIQETDESVQQKKQNLELEQEAEMAGVVRQHQADLNATLATQEKEVAMEASIHDAEMKMLLEKRILNSVLNTVVDGIINIDPKGIIVRFNAAAEAIFGYSSIEVIGKNINMLMPERFSREHDGYLSKYMATGIKKVTGGGRRAYGLRKNDDEFPLHLSVSEVKEDAAHLFTGIVRDLTEEVNLERENRAKEEAKQRELETLVQQLDKSQKQADGMLPPKIAKQLMDGVKVEPTAFEESTIFFSDIVGFTTISSGGSPLDTVKLLNDLYNCFDTIIAAHNAYKVETISDAYMVVSGVPNPNGDKHAGEIATMALEFLSAVYSRTFQVRDDPNGKIQIRIGLNSGPVVAGVVGTKMPRYCLFGDAVNTASRMESTGVPMKIHISQDTAEALTKLGGYHIQKRGEINVKGKGSMHTYFLVGKDSFAKPLPPADAE
ncbi:Guanylate cyclase 2G [Rhizophlyctis rosea]|nr:Guanylate cyclase 2G [Rhizophlyctis rosea]